MNAVEIEEAVSKLMEAAFEPAEFPYAFLEAFDNKDATIRRLRSAGKNTTNKTDFQGDGIVAVLQRNNIHITAPPYCIGRATDMVDETMQRLVESSPTSKHKAKFVLLTDGRVVDAARLNSDEPPLVCEYKDLDNHFGYFLELAGISTVRQIRENAFDIKATGRLNRLYVDPNTRVVGASKYPTFLLAKAELVATYELANINRKALEATLHKFFAKARLDVALADRFGDKVHPREWFLVPLAVIAEVVDRIKDGSIAGYRYDVATASLAKRK